MKETWITWIAASAIAIVLIAQPAHAQLSSAFSSKIQARSLSLGRDCWFALPSNLWGVEQTGTYINIYITSQSNTTAWIESGGTRDSVIATPFQISTYHVPEAWEMESSGIVENKGIHVYSNDAEISVNFISNQPENGEGSYIIPTIGWGLDYVVAAYGSLFEGFGGGPPDCPSECVIVADEDSTSIEITPSCNCRKCSGGNIGGDDNSDIATFPQGQMQTFHLNQGQSLQLMALRAEGPDDDFDLTGTIIHTNHPIGVIGGSMETNIPADYAYPNFVCEMIPPIRTWGKEYIATNYAQLAGDNNKDNALYLFISTVPNQTIYRHDCSRGDGVQAVIANQYGIQWDEEENAIKFTSAYPFLCVSYSNSETYPDGVNGLSYPTECAVPSGEQYRTSVLFETPPAVGSIAPFISYAILGIAIPDEAYTTFDSQTINGFSKQCIDDTFEIFTIPKIASGAHRIAQDLTRDPYAAGVGVYFYGYGYDESYAWSTPEGVATYQTADDVAPIADTMTHCYQAFVHVSDSGLLPNPADTQSGLAAIWQDSLVNMTFVPDSDWIEGSGADTGGYAVTVIDPTQPGFAQVVVYDLGGNVTTVTTTFRPSYAAIEPPLQNLGVSIADSVKKAYDTIFNAGKDTILISALRLAKGNVGFTIYDSIGGPVDLSPLPPGERRLIQIQFKAMQLLPVTDNILVGNDCYLSVAELIGSGGADDFTVSNRNWMNELLPAPAEGYRNSVTISNLSDVSITIDSAWWSDTVHFKAVSAFPITVAALPGTAQFTIAYFPDTNSILTPDKTVGSWFCPLVELSGVETPRFDTLIGSALAPLSVSDANNSAPQATILATNDGRSLEIVLPPNAESPITLELVNVLGESVLSTMLGSGTQPVDASALPRGVYLYRLTAGHQSQSGKVLLGQ